MNSGEQLTLGIFVAGIILAILGYLFRRNELQHSTTQAALAQQSEALAKILERGSIYKDYPTRFDAHLTEHAGLVERVNGIEETHKQDLERVWEYLSPKPLRNSEREYKR